ncbi:MAG: hypothetical protein COS84_09010 [Armatimonadetes bacterium CG07_land_8_20_14_0_80_40_9]|nr:MAG: hypothetical protein COS84_09010 [Armatimonadetes bacterium CG07_land_8_20_14_0_80_40_9]
MLSRFLKSKFCLGLAYLMVIGLIFSSIPTVYAKEEERTLKGAATNLEEAQGSSSIQENGANKIKGEVVGIGKDRAWIDLGTTQGLKDGMELQLKREGRVIGVIKVRRASEYSSEVEAVSLEVGMRIEIGDEVVNLPKKEVKKEVTTKEPTIKTTPPKKDITTDTVPPILIITTMVQGIITSQEEIEIKGKVEEGADVLVNGLPAKVNERNEFATKVKLSEGKNKITIVAKDKAGNQKEEVMELTRSKKKKGFNETLVYGVFGASLLAFLLSGGKKGKATPTGKIDISSIPLGAKIYIDDQDAGKETPSLIESVEVGIHAVKLTKDDYKSWENEVVEIEEGQTTSVEAILELSSEPPSPPFRE